MNRCQHCGRPRVNRPRGLCWRCFYAPGVRDLYPVTSKYCYRGLGNGDIPERLPDVPTSAAPGTPEKLAAFAQRVAEKRALFHPADARFEGDRRPLALLEERAA